MSLQGSAEPVHFSAVNSVALMSSDEGSNYHNITGSDMA